MSGRRCIVRREAGATSSARGGRLLDASIRLSVAACFVALPLGSLVHAATPGEGGNQLFGIRLGMPLDAQFGECAPGESVFTAAAAPCWRRDRFGSREVLLPRAWIAQIGIPLRVDRMREWDGVVVEIEVEIYYADRKRAERYLLERRGKPTETETYEMHGRLTGLSRHIAHTWKSAGVTVHYLERAGSDNTRVRAYVDAWAQQEAEFQKRFGRGG